MNAKLGLDGYRSSARFFVLFLALAVWAFWPSYFARLFEQPDAWFHAHGVVLTAWLVMLVTQAQLIRTGRRVWHRRVGKLSYVLAPAVVAISAVFVHRRVAAGLQDVPQLPAIALHFLALTLGSLVVFAIFYALAIGRRRNAHAHARWMVCTVFPLVTPVTDRLIAAYAPFLIALVPRIAGSPILPAVGFALADSIVLGLAVWDWRANGRRQVFPAALGVLLVYHASALTLHRVTLWNDFCVWFLALPLS